MTNQFHEANRRRWDAGSESWARRADLSGTWRECHRNPSLALHDAELRWFGDVAGKNVAVLGSGDNKVVFALSGMGAKVTSIDISWQQLIVARHRAAELGLHVEFVQADVVDMSMFNDAVYDVVYTGGHVAHWVSDLNRYYAEAARILKPKGLLIVKEYHPIRHMWHPFLNLSRVSSNCLHQGVNYFERGPYRSEVAPEVLPVMPGGLEQFIFHWTVADYITAISSSGCKLIHLEEFDDSQESWETTPLAGLPASILFIGRRCG